MKEIIVEWRHLEVAGATCERCGDTGAALRAGITALTAECGPRGVQPRLREIPLPPEALADSNTILIDGRPIEGLLADTSSGSSDCPSCGELTGDGSARCRTVSRGGVDHEAIPMELVREAFCRVAGCCPPAVCGCGG